MIFFSVNICGIFNVPSWRKKQLGRLCYCFSCSAILFLLHLLSPSLASTQYLPTSLVSSPCCWHQHHGIHCALGFNVGFMPTSWGSSTQEINCGGTRCLTLMFNLSVNLGEPLTLEFPCLQNQPYVKSTRFCWQPERKPGPLDPGQTASMWLCAKVWEEFPWMPFFRCGVFLAFSFQALTL